MTAPIQSPAKCEVHSVKRFLNAKCERPAEIHKQIVAVYGNVMNWAKCDEVVPWILRRNSTTMMKYKKKSWRGNRASSRLLWLGYTEAGSKTW